jgi:CubicO group peptidase (beta-lactamase class C family)
MVRVRASAAATIGAVQTPGIAMTPARTLAQVQRGMDLGWHTGAQVYASVEGQVLIDLAVGEARPGVPMMTSTIVEWASATKPIPCVGIGLLWQRGLLDLDDPVCLHIPEFAAAGKQAVTIRHLLTHTGGLTSTITGVAPPEVIMADICSAPLADGWTPGARCAYNSVAMWIVSELVSRVSGRPFVEFVRSEIFAPAGMDDCWIGMPADVYREAAYWNGMADAETHARRLPDLLDAIYDDLD